MIVDAYSHTGLPRFQTVNDYRGQMRRAGIDKVVFSAFDSAPDLAGIHAAFTAEPKTFRGLGVPLGNDLAEIEAGARAQLEAGFSGLRLTEADVLERPTLGELAGAAGGIILAVGRLANPAYAMALRALLDQYPLLDVVGGHFAGGGTPADLDRPQIAGLFDHPRFSVVFSRHGGYPPSIRDWAAALVGRLGWSRLMWGAESPVLFWRNETIPQALAWADFLGPAPAERAAFFGGNAQRIYFDRPFRPAPLQLPFDPATRRRPIHANLWMNGLPVRQDLAGRLVADWLASGGEGSLGQHLEAVLDRTLPALD